MSQEEKKAARRILAKLYARGDYDLAGMIEQYLDRRGRAGSLPVIPAIWLE
jgi:hypothetical protein